MRIRTVKPELWKHPVIGRLPSEEKVLAVALFSMADDEGFFRAHPALVRAEILPFEEDLQKISGILRKLSGIKWIALRKHSEQGELGLILTFKEHQKISHPTQSKLKKYWEVAKNQESSGEIPEPSGKAPEKFRNPPEKLRPDQGSGIRDQGSYIYISESDKNKLTEKNSKRPDIEVETDPSLRKIQEVVVQVAGDHWDPLIGPDLVHRLRSTYCGVGVDLDAVVRQIGNDLAIRGDISIGCWADVSKFLNGKFRDYSRRYRTAPLARSGQDAATQAYNAMQAVIQCLERGLPVDPERLLIAWNTAVEDRRTIPVDVRSLVDGAIQAGWIERLANGKIEPTAIFVVAETAETLSSPKSESNPEQIRRLIAESPLGRSRAVGEDK